MSDYVRFTKDGLVACEWNKELRAYDSTPLEAQSVFRSLRVRCEIDHDVTLGDFFKTVATYPVLVTFLAQYCWCWSIEDFHAEALLPRVDRKEDEQLEALEISQHFEIQDPNPKYPSIENIQMTTDFHGIGNGDSPQHWSVSLSRMNELAHLPLRLKCTAPLLRNFENAGEWPCCFTLLEVFDAVYDDIAFHGGPESKREFLGDLIGNYILDSRKKGSHVYNSHLIQMADDVKSGRANTVPWEPEKEVVN